MKRRKGPDTCCAECYWKNKGGCPSFGCSKSPKTCKGIMDGRFLRSTGADGTRCCVCRKFKAMAGNGNATTIGAPRRGQEKTNGDLQV